MKVLIIDDFATMRKIINNYLNQLGYTDVTQAENAEAGWEIMQKDDFDLVISDFNMPEMNGLELLSKVRNEYRNKQQRFILLTAETDTDLIINSKNLKVDGYILKPFKIDVLETKLNSLFN
jgi:two-component system, chemotaxis family, chemotaxis protein CheY